ncbi:MAG: hypothetical protein ACOX61_11135 [Brooklawnia sp.]|jgi:hypothetical protein
MPKYKIQNRTIKAGMFADAEDRIERGIQPLLDAGSKNGWRLHSFQATDSNKGINLVLIWEVPE